ncbi:hypothetical protein FH972_009815 [Carpinus fangiana]|uniref:glucan endo-1,3-beta-D-glucosidase n=1 Tax=Carpinus fangiana TaxID=176857 RepID=A0A660KTC2_9ROSI|nr:hypothetical protein FH972_009815 [Carpinus fangiana]
MDALYSALEKVGEANMGVVVSESHWPSASVIATTVKNVGTYYSSLIRYSKNGRMGLPRGPDIEKLICLPCLMKTKRVL